MAKEQRRGCGYRKVGGLYMVSGKLSSPCGRLPLELHVCPTCNQGVKQSRAWTWFNPRRFFDPARLAYECRIGAAIGCGNCPLAPRNLPEKAGLLWIGEKFYPSADDFMREAHAMGVSRRIPAIPRNFKLGETWVLIAHPRAVTRLPRTPEELEEVRAIMHPERLKAGEDPAKFPITRGGIITMFKPTAIEKIVTESQSKDAEAMEELERKGITPVVVPDNDRDHQGTAHDREDDEPQLGLQ